jgi:hypothetical protein
VFKANDETATYEGVTVTEQTPSIPPQTALIEQEPTSMAVIVPSHTVATLTLEDAHSITPECVAFDGVTTATNLAEAPVSRLTELGLIETASTGTISSFFPLSHAHKSNEHKTTLRRGA